MKKILMSLIVMIGVLSGCSSSSGGSDGVTTLTFWNGFTGSDEAYVTEMVDKYNESQGNYFIEMEIMPWDSLHQKLTVALPSGEGPDLMAFDSTYVSTYAQGGFLLDVSNMYDSEIDASQFSDELRNTVMYEGTEYGVPFNLATLSLYYNKDMFDTAGIEYPTDDWTWENLIPAAKKLSETEDNGSNQYGFGIASKETIPNWPVLMWGNGGQITKDGKSTLNSTENVETFTTWSNLITKDHISPGISTGSELDKLFETGQLAMYINGPWAAPGFEEKGINFDVAQVPAGPAGEATLGTSVTLTASSTTENIEGVKDFMEWWSSYDTQLDYSIISGFPPVRADVANDSKLEENKYVTEFAKGLDNAYFYLSNINNATEIENSVLVPVYESIILEQDSVENTLKKGDEELNEMIES